MSNKNILWTKKETFDNGARIRKILSEIVSLCFFSKFILFSGHLNIFHMGNNNNIN